ncbi:MAG TPA: methyltransferase, partial [Ferruginibacter sp.]|nr:methyltransferase [Ferruginibacter sp.]
FQFKQFTVFQHKCAMKVCTDACLFGALAAGYKPQTTNGLDIGTGTGLLSLMLAQKDPDAVIDAVELDTDAAEQARENFAASPWKERLNIFNADILSFKTEKSYDFIISNPPFFEDDLRSPDETKNNAKHDTSLSLNELVRVAQQILAADGSFAVLLPYQRVNYFTEEAGRQGLHLVQQVLVKQTEKHNYFRGILFFNRKKTQPVTASINIKDKEGNYTPEFVAALKDYYLYL